MILIHTPAYLYASGQLLIVALWISCCPQVIWPDVMLNFTYRATIMDLGCTYEWSNILDFDHNYREQQAAHSFQWGYINPMMKMQCLTNPRPMVNNRRVTPSHQTGNSFSQGRSSYHRSVVQGRSSSRFRSEYCRQWLATGGSMYIWWFLSI